MDMKLRYTAKHYGNPATPIDKDEAICYVGRYDLEQLENIVRLNADRIGSVQQVSITCYEVTVTIEKDI